MNLNKNLIFFEISFLCLILFVIFYRSPCFLLEGTFQQDEFVFYKNSLENGFIKGLFYVYPGAGYFNFWTNLSTGISTFFTQDMAKVVVTYFALSVKLLIFFYIYFFQSKIFVKKAHKIFAISIILFGPPMTPEVWMTTIHSNEYFGILAFVLLFHDFDKSKSTAKKFVRTLVFFSGLSSIYAVTLTPVYFIKYFLIRTKDNLYNFLSIFSAFLIQAIIVVIYNILNVSHIQRFQIEISKLISYIYNVVVRSFFGSTVPKKIFYETNIYSLPKFNYLIIFLFIFIILFSLFYIFKKRDLILNLIVLSLIFISTFVMMGSLYPSFVGGRYAVVPGIILIFLIFRIFITENNPLIKNFCAILLASSLIVGSVEFKYKSPLPELLNCNYFAFDK